MAAPPSIGEVSSYLKKTFTLEKFSTGEGASFTGGNRSVQYFGGNSSIATAVDSATAQGIPVSTDINKIKYDVPVETLKRPLGTITTAPGFNTEMTAIVDTWVLYVIENNRGYLKYGN